MATLVSFFTEAGKDKGDIRCNNFTKYTYLPLFPATMVDLKCINVSMNALYVLLRIFKVQCLIMYKS